MKNIILFLLLSVSCFAANPTTGQFLFQQKPATGAFLPYGVTPVVGYAFGWDGTNVVMLPVGGSSIESFIVAGSTGTPQTITNGDTLTIATAAGLTSIASNIDTVTIGLSAGTSASLALADSAVQPGALTSALAGYQPVSGLSPGGYIARVVSGTGSMTIEMQSIDEDSGTFVQRFSQYGSGTVALTDDDQQGLVNLAGAYVAGLLPDEKIASATTWNAKLGPAAIGVTVQGYDANTTILGNSTTGTGAIVRATSPTLTTPNLGTPSAVTLTNATNLPISTGVSGLGTGVATFLATPTSANLATAVTNETGTGALVFGTSPTIASPVISSATNNTIASFNASNVLTSLATATYPSLTELTYVKGVTSAIQTQLNGKIGGTVGSTTNAVPRADGTGGLTLKASGVFVDDSGIIRGGTNYATASNRVSLDLAGFSGRSYANFGFSQGGQFIMQELDYGDTTNSLLFQLLPSGPQAFFEAYTASNFSIGVGSDSSATIRFDIGRAPKARLASTLFEVYGSFVSSTNWESIKMSHDGSTGILQTVAGTGGGTVEDLVISRGTNERLRLTSTGTNIVGTNTNNSASAGQVGEFVQSLVASGSAVSLTNATTTNVTSISLTAGDWDVEGWVNHVTVAASVTDKVAAITSTSATIPTDGSQVHNGALQTIANSTDAISLPRKRISVASTTTVYLVTRPSFMGGTMTAYGGINARRVR